MFCNVYVNFFSSLCVYINISISFSLSLSLSCSLSFSFVLAFTFSPLQPSLFLNKRYYDYNHFNRPGANSNRLKFTNILNKDLHAYLCEHISHSYFFRCALASTKLSVLSINCFGNHHITI